MRSSYSKWLHSGKGDFKDFRTYIEKNRNIFHSEFNYFQLIDQSYFILHYLHHELCVCLYTSLCVCMCVYIYLT